MSCKITPLTRAYVPIYLLCKSYTRYRNALGFDSSLFLQAAAFDPGFAFNWLEDHPGMPGEKEALRYKINGLHCLKFYFDDFTSVLLTHIIYW